VDTTQRIAERLKALRTEKNMTQGEVAENAGINANYYAKVERGEVTASIPMLEKLASVLEVDISKIFSRTNSDANGHN
jgi:transcriptional regulator with XRE-family HTH domain